MIELKHVTRKFTNGDIENIVLKDINLTILEGEFVCILGTSGSGKSTLLNIIGLIDNQSSGDYLLENKEMTQEKSSSFASIRGEKFGFVFQSFHLANELTVIENVAMPLGYQGISKKNRLKRSRDVLKMVGLTSKEELYPNLLSGGEKQRVAIARALVNHPKIIIADEPTGNLDLKNTQIIMKLFEEFNQKGVTIILVTHDESLVKKAHRIYHIEDGVIKDEAHSQN
ncbi:ABC transporter ATP-binding protein [Vagococcus carniphilus]|uniref:ABC transporter ATP-binding protein n=1 Tax=Vagococcus carniphilus TaxID=218144 RepID=A0AAW8U3Z9_9ENTE|nr:ABC transporter ATP-binding protein [Vagococcus carniphilus]MDT2830359.1 ABC transporter ATP-binding protein [Vagococcus carniphilus]MDT2834281.1 ABC transporter ATP-binding protein [Vagococcus carniphilus]MDT2840072.1 ABC transporter ATP-binding protein [Vagococcus carniphilus]MDT2854563.1 ABC transporter ATP-binding protein [Vagococcus carniphilus]